jgi:hypothetical protein
MSDLLTILQKWAREEDVEIIIRYIALKPDNVLAHRDFESSIFLGCRLANVLGVLPIVDDVVAIVRLCISQSRSLPNSPLLTTPEPDQKELQDALNKARKDLDVAYDRLHEMTAQYMDNEAKLKRERLIKDLAVACIPKDKLYDFELSCPLGQPQWNGSSSPLVSTTLSSGVLGKTYYLKVERTDSP